MFFLISPSTCYNSVPLFIENPWQQLVHLLDNDLNLNIKENVDKIGKIYQYPPHLFFKSTPPPPLQSNKFKWRSKSNNGFEHVGM